MLSARVLEGRHRLRRFLRGAGDRGLAADRLDPACRDREVVRAAIGRSPPERAGSRSDVVAEERREVTLAGAADLQRDVREAQAAVGEELLGLPDGAADDVLVRRDPGRELEAAAERIATHVDRIGDIVPGELRVDVVVHEADRAPQRVAGEPLLGRRWRVRARVAGAAETLAHYLGELAPAMLAPILLG